MKIIYSILLTLITVNLFSQNIVLEYTNDFNVDFKIYEVTNNSKNKISSILKTDCSTPEGLAQSFFFANNDEWLKSTYLEHSNFSPMESKHYQTIKKMVDNKNKIIFLHKFSFNVDGSEMCYINFIAELEGIDFKFPILLSCIKKDNKWYIFNLSNQEKIRDILWNFRSCRIMQLINGQNTKNTLMNNLIKKTKNYNNFLDINKLYDESLTWTLDDDYQRFFTMTDNNNCDDITSFSLSKKVNLTSIFKSITIKNFEKNDQKKNTNIIEELKRSSGKDSIYLKAKIEVDYDGKNYSIVKYNLINETGKSTSTIKILDSTLDILSKPISELIFLFKNLKPEIFFDLTPSINALEMQKKDSLFKNSRGNFDITNSSKLYELYKSNKSLFSKYLDN